MKMPGKTPEQIEDIKAFCRNMEKTLLESDAFFLNRTEDLRDETNYDNVYPIPTHRWAGCTFTIKVGLPALEELNGIERGRMELMTRLR